MVFFLATLVTAAVFITDRMEGVWERTLVAGMNRIRFQFFSLSIHFLLMNLMFISKFIGAYIYRFNLSDKFSIISIQYNPHYLNHMKLTNNVHILLGITTPELLLAHILTQSVIVFLQCTEVIFFIGVVFGTENNGDNLTVILLLSLTGFAGMLFGWYFLLMFHRSNIIMCLAY